MRVRLGLAFTALLLIALLAGCERAPLHEVADREDRDVDRVASRAWELTLRPGPKIRGLVHDRSIDPSSTAVAFAALRSELPSLLKEEYQYGPPRDRRLPRSADALLKAAVVDLIPVFVVDSTTPSGEGVYRGTRQDLSEYIGVVTLDGAMVGALDWSSPPPRGQRPGSEEVWSSFYSAFYLDFERAENMVRRHFGNGDVRVRYVKVPRGWWVVGRSDGSEKAAFVAHQGSYDDDPNVDRLYDAGEVLEYVRSHPIRRRY